jgi:transposase
MSKLHANAALTISQRKLMRSLYLEGASISSLARRFGVNRKCADRWAKRATPYDKASGPKVPKTVITKEYRRAVLEHRAAHPDHGAITIAFYLKEEFDFANRGTVQKILSQRNAAQEKCCSRQERQPKAQKN